MPSAKRSALLYNVYDPSGLERAEWMTPLGPNPNYQALSLTARQVSRAERVILDIDSVVPLGTRLSHCTAIAG